MGVRAGAALGPSLAVALNDDPLCVLLARHGVEARLATRDDLDFAFETLRDAMGDAVASAFGGWDDADQRARFAPTFDLATHRVLRQGGADAGIVAVEWLVDRIHLSRIFLASGVRRRGLGTRVLRALAAEADARRYPIVVTVLRTNPDAVRFYEGLGFVHVAATPTHVHLEREPVSAASRK